VDDLRRFVAHIEDVRILVGPDVHKRPLESETPARLHARRSIVLDKPVLAGDTITELHLTCKRPGTGISPLQWDDVIGRRARRDLEADTVLAWSDLEIAVPESEQT
jgi:N-acetylneuraminate synthase